MSKDIGGLRGGGRGEPEGMPCADRADNEDTRLPGLEGDGLGRRRAE